MVPGDLNTCVASTRSSTTNERSWVGVKWGRRDSFGERLKSVEGYTIGREEDVSKMGGM